MSAMVLTFLLGLLQQTANFDSTAPLGTELEWMVLGSIILPALALVALAYLGRDTV